MSANFSSFLKQINFIECNVLCDEPMSRHTSFKTGGNAKFFLTVKNVDALKKVLTLVRENELKFFILGNGTNVLFRDEGFDGVVISLSESLCETGNEGDEIYCDAGVSLMRMCRLALEKGLSGAEFAYGIPGSVGGAVVMNAGAYGGEIKDILVSVTHLTPGGIVETVDAKNLDLSYRHSFYTDNPGYIVLGARFALKESDVPSIKEKMEDLLARRQEKQPLEFPSAGSTFKRPEGNFAGALIEQCGLKGTRVGGAMVSEKHAGFIVNFGSATSSDVLNLIELVRSDVLGKTGIELDPEVKIVG